MPDVPNCTDLTCDKCALCRGYERAYEAGFAPATVHPPQSDVVGPIEDAD